MFVGTGGTFKDTPTINTKYYAWSEKVEPDNSKDTNIKTTVSQVYVWTMTPSLTNAEGTIDVGVSQNTISYGKQLVITYKGNNDENGNHYLVDKNNANNKLQYTITGYVNETDGTALIATASNTTTNQLAVTVVDNKTYAGTYSDYLTFTCSIENIPTTN